MNRVDQYRDYFGLPEQPATFSKFGRCTALHVIERSLAHARYGETIALTQPSKVWG